MSAVDELLAEALEGCELLDMDVMVSFGEDNFTAVLDGRVVNGSLTTEGGDEVLQQQSIAGDVVRMRWNAGVADGDRTPMTGWVQQARRSDEDRYRCFDGDVRVRLDDRGDIFYVFAADTLYEATVDGTCGAPTIDEVAFGCLPGDY